MSTSNQAPFAKLVEYFKGAFQSANQISIPSQILATFQNSTQPIDDTGLQDLVKLFDKSHPCNRFRLDSSVFCQLVRIIFGLQPSLLQLKLIYFLLVPPQATDLEPFKLWRRSVLENLIPAILGLLQEGVLPETLLIGAADSLALFIHGDEEAKRTIYIAQDELRCALGTIIDRHDSYVLRIAVSNLVREFMTARFDRHLFWPNSILATSFNDFPLAEVGDAKWLSNAVEFLSAANFSKACRADLPEVHFVQYAGFEHLAAIISDDITLVLPAISLHPLGFLRLPLIEGMVCLSSGSQHNEVIIRYRSRTGYQIYQGVKRTAGDIRLILEGHTQSIAFTNSVQSRLADKLAETSLAHELKLACTRMSYASIDLSQSRDTSVESQDETNNFLHVPEPAVLVTMPSLVDTQGVADGQLRQERTTERSRHESHAHTNPFSRISAGDPFRKILPDLQSRRKKTPTEGPIDQNSAILSVGGNREANESMKDKQSRLKRPTVKGVSTPNRNDIDWDQDLRSDKIEPEAPAAKRVKIISKKAGKSKSSATRKTSPSKSKTGNKQEKTKNSKAKVSEKTAASTRIHRPAVTKSAKYVEQSDSDLHDEHHRQSSSVVQDLSPLTKDEGLWKKDKIHVADSQGRKDYRGLNSDELCGIKSLPTEESSSATPASSARLKQPAHDEEAIYSHPMDTAAKAEALTKSDTSFGTKIAQTLTAKAHLLVAPVNQPLRKSFGNVKKFVEIVNLTRMSSPEKSLAKELRSVQPDRHKAAIHQRPSNDPRPTNSIAQHSHPQAQSTKPIESRLEAQISYQSPGEGNQQCDNVHLAHTEAAPTTLPTEETEQILSTSLHDYDLEQAVPKKVWKDDLDLAAVALKQINHQEKVSTTEDTGEENPVKNSNTSDESLESELPKSASTVSRWPPIKQKSQIMLQEILKNAETEKSMHPPPLPPRPERQSFRSPSNIIRDGGEISLLKNERTQRKTPIVSFGTQGPHNQDVSSLSKKPNATDVSVPVPAETEKHAAAKRSKKRMPFEPIRLAALLGTSGEVSDQRSEAVNEDEGILVQEENIFRSLVTVPSLDDPDEEGILVEEENAVETKATSSYTLRRNASQPSRVDENGSPRLHQLRPFLVPPVNSQRAANLSEKSESSVFASNELEHSVYADQVHLVPLPVWETFPQGAKQHAKTTMMQTRTSIGVQEVLSQKFPEASKSMNTAAFKQKVKSKLPRPSVVIEKSSEAAQKSLNVAEKGLTACPLAMHPEVDGVPPSPSPQQSPSNTNTRILRLSPKTAVENSKAAKEASSTPTPFMTSFKNMLMPPPPLPLIRQGQTNLRAALTLESNRGICLATENEDVTLINDENSAEYRPIQSTTLRQRQQSPNSTYSQSSPIPEHIQPNQDSRKENQKQYSPKIRFTQQNILDILSRVARDVLFRLQMAEQAIQGKTQEYHSGCYTLVDKLETTYEACVQHERSRANPRVAELCESYNMTVTSTSKGIRRVRGGVELDSLSEKIEKRRTYLLSIIHSQMEEIELAEQDAE